MLFDHGADAVSAFFLAVQVMKILKLSYGLQLIAIYAFIMNTYFCAMWSQYCVGYFKLGRVNPVDEGLPSYAIFCLVVTQLDLSGLTKYHIIGTVSQEIVLFLTLLLIPQTIYMVKDIFKNRIVEK